MKTALWFLISFFLISGCEPGKTSGEIISFQTAIEGSAKEGSKEQFHNLKGYEVELEKALFTAGPLYFYNKRPISASLKCPAHALQDKGSVLGEIEQQFVIDLLKSKPIDTGYADGEKGILRMAELHIHPPQDPRFQQGSSKSEFAQLESYSILIEGIAKKDGDEYKFIADLIIPPDGTMRIVENIGTVDEPELDNSDDYTVVLKVFLDRWFINVEFSSLYDETEDIYRFSQNEDSQAYAAFLSAVRSSYSYLVERRKK